VLGTVVKKVQGPFRGGRFRRNAVRTLLDTYLALTRQAQNGAAHRAVLTCPSESQGATAMGVVPREPSRTCPYLANT
jgi:hypothetical protein